MDRPTFDNTSYMLKVVGLPTLALTYDKAISWNESDLSSAGHMSHLPPSINVTAKNR